MKWALKHGIDNGIGGGMESDIKEIMEHGPWGVGQMARGVGNRA